MDFDRGMTSRRIACFFATAAAGLCVAAPSAVASTIGFQGSGSTHIVFAAGDVPPDTGASVANQVTVSEPSPGVYRVSDPAEAITPSFPCTQGPSANDADCPAPAGPVGLDLWTGGLNDIVRLTSLPVDPNLSVMVKGGSGDDGVFGGPEVDIVDGQAGNDWLDGGAGADVLNGGDGIDAVDYSSRTAPVAVTLDGVANDGELGEGDNVGTDVENVTGGAGDDTLTGSDSDNVLSGGPGNDILNGGLGADSYDGGPGNDTIVSRDMAGESVACGAGSDTATVDFLDLVNPDCEIVNWPVTTMRISSAPLTLSARGTVAVAVACGHDQLKGCRGRITLRLARSSAASLGGRRAQAARRGRPPVIGHADYQVAANRKKTVKVHIARRGRARVENAKKRHKKVNVTISIAQHTPAGTKVARRTVRLRIVHRGAHRR
jgi:hypothetical protein